MKLSEQVLCAIDDVGAGKFNSALLHACIAIDATSKRLDPTNSRVGARYISCLRNYYWLIEPMLGAGINLVETKFENIRLKKNNAPDLAEIIYEVFRCSHAHGDEVSVKFDVIPTSGSVISNWLLGPDVLQMPDRIIWALLSVAVFSVANQQETSSGDYYLSLGEERFLIKEWWGREHDFRSIADRYNQTRIKIEGLNRLRDAGQNGEPHNTEILEIVQPYFNKERM